MLGKVQTQETRNQLMSRREYQDLLDAVRQIKYEERLSAEDIITSAKDQLRPCELYEGSFDSRFITKNELICRRQYEARMKKPLIAASTENIVMLGPNGTIVAKKEFEGIQWVNAAVATRMLLTLIFDRQTLATHTHRRPSHACCCQDRLSKPSLDFAKVSDVIYCVQKRFGCTEMEISLLIVMTCADVAKSFKSKEN